MGCPSAAIVIEELTQLGVKKIKRVGTCGGLRRDLTMGDIIVALSATPADSTASHYVHGEPHAPTADFGLVHDGTVDPGEQRQRLRPQRLDRPQCRPAVQAKRTPRIGLSQQLQRRRRQAAAPADIVRAGLRGAGGGRLSMEAPPATALRQYASGSAVCAVTRTNTGPLVPSGTSCAVVGRSGARGTPGQHGGQQHRAQHEHRRDHEGQLDPAHVRGDLVQPGLLQPGPADRHHRDQEGGTRTAGHLRAMLNHRGRDETRQVFLASATTQEGMAALAGAIDGRLGGGLTAAPGLDLRDTPSRDPLAEDAADLVAAFVRHGQDPALAAIRLAVGRGELSPRDAAGAAVKMFVTASARG